MTVELKKYYKDKLYDIAHREYDKNNIVLLGDCLVDNMDITKYFPNTVIYNNGISGDTTSTLKETLYKRCIKYKPSKVFVSIGSNDFGYDGNSVKDTYNNIVDIVDEIKKRSRDTEIILVTVIPVNIANADYIRRDLVDNRDNYEISMLNYYLKNFARKNRIKILDIYKYLKNDFDQLDLDYTFDGYHLNDSGYQVVTKLIKQLVWEGHKAFSFSFFI